MTFIAFDMADLDALVRSIDPETPFRAIKDHQHHTWARTYHSRPQFYIQPHTQQEIQKITKLAQRCGRRLVVVGSTHSPSDLTLTSSWMINLDVFNGVLDIDRTNKTITVQAGIRVRDLNARAKEHGWTIPNLGSIDDQSIAGAIATATHGSSLKHGLLSACVKSLKIVLASGAIKTCSAKENESLFRAALVSLGALGIIVEVEYQMVDLCKVEWTQDMVSISIVLDKWSSTLWTEKEFTRVWWLPHTKRAIVWSAERTEKEIRDPKASWYGGALGFHVYHTLLWISNRTPRILPWIEWFVFGMQYGFSNGHVTSAVQPLREALLMDCLYSQFVNEWAIPLEKGPEAITRLSQWLNQEPGHNIPFDNKQMYVHGPIEVRVSDTSRTQPRPYLDTTCATGPTLFLNATLYRPYLEDPPCRARYYQAFEYLMREMGGRPHWAKNFTYTSLEYIQKVYGDDLNAYLKVRDEVDPEGMFLGGWHRQFIIPDDRKPYALEESVESVAASGDGGKLVTGQQV